MCNVNDYTRSEDWLERALDEMNSRTENRTGRGPLELSDVPTLVRVLERRELMLFNLLAVRVKRELAAWWPGAALPL